MALKATIFKAGLQIADIDRNYQDGQIWLGNGKDRMSVEPDTLTRPAAAVR